MEDVGRQEKSNDYALNIQEKNKNLKLKLQKSSNSRLRADERTPTLTIEAWKTESRVAEVKT